VWIGSRLRSTENPLRIGAAVVAGSLQFFLITNFAWLVPSRTYPHTLGGLVSCYIAAIPFYGRTLAVRPAVFGRSVRPARLAQPHGGAVRTGDRVGARHASPAFVADACRSAIMSLGHGADRGFGASGVPF
jgi:hypothetical protein